MTMELNTLTYSAIDDFWGVNNGSDRTLLGHGQRASTTELLGPLAFGHLL